MKIFAKALLGLAVMGLATGALSAAVIGTQGFSDIGSPSVNTGDINTATTFNLGEFISNATHTGVFVGMPSQDFGAVTFNDAAGANSSFSISNAVFGTFTSTSISEITNVSGSVALFILGSYTSGTYAPGAAGDVSSFTISFTQTPAGSGSISDSATFADPAASVPEPATMSLLGGALLGLGFLRRRRKA